MKQITKQLRDFILAFDLAQPLNAVCFDAMVFFYTDTLKLEIESEIHIVTIQAKNVDVLYILNPEISELGFPDMFQSSQCEIDFKERKGLLIEYPGSETLRYSILIQPTGKDCEPVSVADFQNRINLQ